MLCYIILCYIIKIYRPIILCFLGLQRVIFYCSASLVISLRGKPTYAGTCEFYLFENQADIIFTILKEEEFT